MHYEFVDCEMGVITSLKMEEIDGKVFLSEVQTKVLDDLYQ